MRNLESGNNKIKWSAITILFLFLCVATNYTSGFFLSLIFTVMFIGPLFIQTIKKKENRKLVTFGLFSLIIVIFLSYNIYLVATGFQSTVGILNDLNGPVILCKY